MDMAENSCVADFSESSYLPKASQNPPRANRWYMGVSINGAGGTPKSSSILKTDFPVSKPSKF